MGVPVMGIQLYTLRDHIQSAEDFDSTLERLGQMGVDTVQISGIGDIPAQEQRAILDKHSMKVCITHKGLDRMLEDLAGLAEEHRVIGCDAVGLGCAPSEAQGSLEAVRSFIRQTQAIGKTLHEQGMSFNYHNHDFEFKKLEDGRTMMDVLIEETNPDFFSFIPDVAWIHYAGYDPVEYLKKLRGRVRVVHFKDYIIENGERKFATLGTGAVDLRACYDICCELSIPYIMYEQDSDWEGGDPFISTLHSWEFMRGL